MAAILYHFGSKMLTVADQIYCMKRCGLNLLIWGFWYLGGQCHGFMILRPQVWAQFASGRCQIFYVSLLSVDLFSYQVELVWNLLIGFTIPWTDQAKRKKIHLWIRSIRSCQVLDMIEWSVKAQRHTKWAFLHRFSFYSSLSATFSRCSFASFLSVSLEFNQGKQLEKSREELLSLSRAALPAPRTSFVSHQLTRRAWQLRQGITRPVVAKSAICGFYKSPHVLNMLFQEHFVSVFTFVSCHMRLSVNLAWLH